MEHLPMHLHFDSAQSFTAWLATALPHYHHEARGSDVLVTSGPLSGVLIKPDRPGYITVAHAPLPGWVSSLVALVQFAALILGFWSVFSVRDSPSIIDAREGFSTIGAVWWATAMGGVAFMVWLPKALVGFIGRSGAEPIRTELAALLSRR